MLLNVRNKPRRRDIIKKRKGHGNQYTVSRDICNSEETTVNEVPPDVVWYENKTSCETEAYKNSSVSSKKVKEVNASQSNILEGCRFINLSILSEIV